MIAGSQSTASPLWPVHFTVDVLSWPEHALNCAMRDTASQQALAKETIADDDSPSSDMPPNCSEKLFWACMQFQQECRYDSDC